MIQKYAIDYVGKNDLKHSILTNFVKKKWFRPFMERLPELRRRKAQHMNPARAQKLNKFFFKKFYAKLKQVLENMLFFD